MLSPQALERNNREAGEMEASNASDWGRGSFTNIIQLLVRPIRLAGGKEENKTDDAKLRAVSTD